MGPAPLVDPGEYGPVKHPHGIHGWNDLTANVISPAFRPGTTTRMHRLCDVPVPERAKPSAKVAHAYGGGDEESNEASNAGISDTEMRVFRPHDCCQNDNSAPSSSTMGNVPEMTPAK
jgi:hypothetical protein